MISSDEKMLFITGNKKDVETDLIHIMQTLLIEEKVFTIRQMKKIIRKSVKKKKIKVDTVEMSERKKRMNELDSLLKEFKGRNRK